MKILVVGNSLIHQSGLPDGTAVDDQFSAMANAAGHVVQYDRTRNNAFEDHWFDTDGPNVTDLLNTGNFDLVIMNSANAEVPDGDADDQAMIDRFNTYADLIADLADANGTAQLFYGLYGGTQNLDASGSTFVERADPMYREAAIRNGAAYAANAHVWEEVHRRLTETYGNGDDGETAELMMYNGLVHPSVLGAYVLACSVYATVFSEMPPPVSVYLPDGISTTDANMIRNVAWDFAQQYSIFLDDPGGGGGSDVINGTTGADELVGTGIAETLNGFAGNDDLFGGGGDDTLNGDEGNDRLYGEAGNDVMNGGDGDDQFYVTDALDVVNESSGNGTDRVFVAFDYVLGANVENLTLQGSAAISGTGNAAANRMDGNSGGNTLDGLAGNDRLNGQAGSDRLIGGTGRDRLTGGADADTFVFAEAGSANRDTILDYQAGIDRIELSGTAFGLAAGPLDASQFTIGTAASAASHRIVYDQVNGEIYFDADGSGSASRQLLGFVNDGTILTADDFIIG